MVDDFLIENVYIIYKYNIHEILSFVLLKSKMFCLFLITITMYNFYLSSITIVFFSY